MKSLHGSIRRVGLALAAFVLVHVFPASGAVNIPALTWTQRSDWLNVKSAPFNAAGDGVTDDTAAIQAALTLSSTCNSHGQAVGYKRTVYLPQGTYKITHTLNWRGTNTPWTDGGSGLQLIGCGRNTTIVWSGSSGAAMFATDSATRSNYIGITWNGNNLAGAGYRHDATIHYEDPVRHQNEAFYNFTVNGTYLSGTTCPPCGIMNGTTASTVFSADVLVWNCLFNSCSNGVIIGYQVANNYQWCIEGCEFENCGTGVNCGQYAMTTIFDCHFQGSSVVDICTNPSLAQSIRCCTSQGSRAFVSIPQSAAYGPQKIQDCRVEGWTSTVSAMDLGNCGPTLVSDCVFANPPNSAPPIRINNNSYGHADLLVSNNYCPPTCTALVAPSSWSTTVAIPPGSVGGPVAALSSGSTTFLQTTWPTDSSNILDVTGTAYNADKTGIADATIAIQKAINDARIANNGSIVYLPLGTYNVTSTLAMSGSNYTVQGSGLCSTIKWTGTNNDIVIAVTSPYNLAIEQLNIGADPSVTAISQTATTGGDMFYDGIQSTLANGLGSNYVGAGVQFVGLPAGSRVFIGHMLSPLTVTDCGPAEIFGQYVENGRLIVNGATQPKTGFLGISNSMEGGNVAGSNYWDILVDDNQDLAIGHLYQEQGYNHLQVNRGTGAGSGRVTIQGVKQNLNPGYTSVLVNNYKGRIVYGPTYFANNASTIITQTGSNALDLIFPADDFRAYAPTITTSSSCRLIQTQNIYTTGSIPATYTFPTDIMPAGASASIAAGFDHLRQLFAEDLKLIHGIQNTVANGSFETDPLNSSPLAAMGTPPASWTISGGTSTGLGVRSVSAVASGSPFSSGTTQSASFVDTTGTGTGNSLSFFQNTILLSPAAAAVFSFDFRLNSMTPLSDSINISVFAGSATAFNVSLNASGTSGLLGAAPLAVNTWYRVRAILPPPGTPTGTVSYTVTPWTAGGPGTASTYSATGLFSAASQGFSKISFNQAAAGNNTNVNFDNITLVTGDPLVSGSFTPIVTGSSLGGCWNFDTATAADSSGNHNDGILINNPAFSVDMPYLPWGNGDSIQLSGSSRMEVSNAATINPNDHFSVAFWVNGGTSGQSSYTRLMSKDGNATSSPGWEIQRSGATAGLTIRIDTSAGSNQLGASISGTAVLDNTWHHAAFVLNGGTSTAYLDGVLVATKTYNSGSGLGNANVPLEVGAGLAGSAMFMGKMDDVRLYNTALSGTDIAALFCTQPRRVWNRQHFTAQQLADPNSSGDLANPAGDGMSNLMKYALNLDPNLPDAVSPTASTIVVGGTTYFCFTHRQNNAAPDISFQYEQSSDLLGWTPATPEIIESFYLDAFTNSVTGQQRLFMLLKVSKP